MPTTLEQLKTSLDNLLGAKQQLLNDMSDISLLDDNSKIFTDYANTILHISRSIDEIKKAIDKIQSGFI